MSSTAPRCSTRTITTRETAAGRRRDVNKLPWGSPTVYFIALLVIAVMLGPVLYIIIGGFRTNSADHPVDPVGHAGSAGTRKNYVDVLTEPGLFWNESAELRRWSGSRPPSARWCSDLMASYVIARYRLPPGGGRCTRCSPQA